MGAHDVIVIGGGLSGGLPGSLGGGVNVARVVAEDLKLGA